MQPCSSVSGPSRSVVLDETTRTGRIRWETATGSIYEATHDGDRMDWSRLSHTGRSGLLRSERAPLLEWPEVRVGSSAVLLSEPFLANGPVRLVLTSRVVAILEVEEAEPGAAPEEVRP